MFGKIVSGPKSRSILPPLSLNGMIQYFAEFVRDGKKFCRVRLRRPELQKPVLNIPPQYIKGPKIIISVSDHTK